MSSLSRTGNISPADSINGDSASVTFCRNRVQPVSQIRLITAINCDKLQVHA